jgi:hypothetical protein
MDGLFENLFSAFTLMPLCINNIDILIIKSKKKKKIPKPKISFSVKLELVGWWNPKMLLKEK